MFTLECLPEDADLFFQILNQRNGNLYKYFKHKQFKYHSRIKCTISPKNTLDGGLYEYIRTDIVDTLNAFTSQRTFKSYAVLATHSSIPSRYYKLDHNLNGHLSVPKAFVTRMRINWKVQQTRSYQKQLLNITG